MITVQELIEKLQEYPPEMPVYVPDGDWGPAPVESIGTEKISVHVQAKFVEGRSYYERIDAVVLRL